MSILVAGNPILDLIAVLPPIEREKFGLLGGGYAEYDPARHHDVYDEMIKLPSTKLIPGGAGQNTARVCQALLQTPCEVVYLGAVGVDKFATLMEEKAKEANLEVLYHQVDKVETGKSAIVVDADTRDRSMCTHIGAANHFDDSFLQKHWHKVESANILFTAGFFVTASPKSLMNLAEHAAKSESKLWGTNLSAPFIVENYEEQVKEWLKIGNFVVGNNDEWEAVRNRFCQGKGVSLIDAVRQLCDDCEWTGHPKKMRVYIMTQGPDPTIVAWRKNKASKAICDHYPVQVVPPELIADTVGCGDAFIGGFLAGLHLGLPLEKCIELGNSCGRELLQHQGVIFDLSKYRENLAAQK